MTKKRKSGVVLVEALIAVTTLATGAFILGSIITSSMSTGNLSKSYLSADNLFNEAFEIVNNIKDSNLLRYPNKKSCWLAIGNDCEKIESTLNENYVVELTNGLWQLIDGPTNALDLASYNPADVNDLQNGYQITLGGQKSKYFRSIVFSYAGDDMTTFEIKIQWKDGSKTNTLRKKISIYNNLI